MKNLLNLDKSNLRQVIIDSPKQFAKGLELAKNIKVPGNFTNVVVSGMGGSSLPIDIFRTYLNSLYPTEKIKEFELIQNRTYSLPHESYDNCLNIFSSYSGTTEETLSSLEEAIKNNLPSIGIATGGKLIELCQANNLPFVILPAGIEPRYATGYFFGSLLQILANQGLISDKANDIVELSKNLEKEVLRLEDRGKELVELLIGKTPVIYSSDKFKSVVMIWKIKINESATTPAFYNVFPELNHNEMAGWGRPQGKFHIITLLDKDEHPQVIKRMRITADFLKEKGTETTIIEMEGLDILNKIFNTLLLGDWAAYYLALAYGQDPTPAKMVNDFKKLL